MLSVIVPAVSKYRATFSDARYSHPIVRTTIDHRGPATCIALIDLHDRPAAVHVEL